VSRSGEGREGRAPSEGGVGWDWNALRRVWIEEGFQDEDFWRQTASSYSLAMEARANVRKRETERDLFIAWHTEAFAREKRLKPLAKYLSPSSQAGQSPKEMLSILKQFREKGANMNIRRVE
jgi:hypothetical protein